MIFQSQNQRYKSKALITLPCILQYPWMLFGPIKCPFLLYNSTIQISNADQSTGLQHFSKDKKHFFPIESAGYLFSCNKEFSELLRDLSKRNHKWYIKQPEGRTYYWVLKEKALSLQVRIGLCTWLCKFSVNEKSNMKGKHLIYSKFSHLNHSHSQSYCLTLHNTL